MNLDFAKKIDQEDTLSSFRDQFFFPKTKDGKDFLYFCGNSLGLQSKAAKSKIENELTKWSQLGVEGHFSSELPWLSYHKNFEASLARLTGAKPSEVVVMNALTVNLHLLLLSFYDPTATKYKIAIEENAFPSDRYAVKSQIDFWYKKGLITEAQSKDAIVYLKTDEWGLYTSENILKQLADESIALCLLSGVNYQTGQVFELEKIAHFCTENNIVIGLDLAHAIGNIPLSLHDWKIDFAVWCSYKYLNGGPGAVGGAFIHQKNCSDISLPKLHGWWSNKEENRFEMNKDIDLYESAEAFQMSNAPIFNMAALLGSCQLFDAVDLDMYYQKGQKLSTYLIELIETEIPQIKIITPNGNKSCQVSLFIENADKSFITKLHDKGIIADWRNHTKGGILRLAPVPLYNSFTDCYLLVQVLKEVFNS